MVGHGILTSLISFLIISFYHYSQRDKRLLLDNMKRRGEERGPQESQVKAQDGGEEEEGVTSLT